MKNEEINELITCPKIIINPPKKNFKIINGSEQNSMTLVCKDDKNLIFAVRLRKHIKFFENFSIMLDLYVPTLDKEIKLIRFNGNHGGEHTNKVINNLSFDSGFHIHKTTEEALNAGIRPEHYAELTNKYTTFEEALIAFWKDVNLLDDIDDYFKGYDISKLPLFKSLNTGSIT